MTDDRRSPPEIRLEARVEAFLAASPIAVVGASADPGKFGHRCLAALLRREIPAIPVNPRGGTILGAAVATELPPGVLAASLIVPPAVTVGVIDRAIELGLRHLWLQEGSEEPRAIERAVRAGIEVIHGGPCLLIELARRSPARTETP